MFEYIFSKFELWNTEVKFHNFHSNKMSASFAFQTKKCLKPLCIMYSSLSSKGNNGAKWISSQSFAIGKQQSVHVWDQALKKWSHSS